MNRRQSSDFQMAVVQQRDGTWGYCPIAALPILGRCMEYSDEPGYPSAEDARAAIKRDKSIPRGQTITIFPNYRSRPESA